MTKQIRRQSSSFCDTTEGQVNLHHYLTKLGIPSGLRSNVISIHALLESRIWILDNSVEMQRMDGCLIVSDDEMSRIEKEDARSRWSEQIQCAEFHRKMAARCWIPTKVSARNFS